MQEEKISGRIGSEKKKTREAAQTKEKWMLRGRRALTEAVWLGGAWLIGLAELPFGTYPLGLALLGGTGKHVAAILAGLLLSVSGLGELGAIYACGYLAASLIRVLAGMLVESADTDFALPRELSEKLRGSGENAEGAEREEKRGILMRFRGVMNGIRMRTLRTQLRLVFSESVCLRMGASGIAALLISLYRIIAGGFRYYDLFSALVFVGGAMLATALFSVSLEKRCSMRVLCLISEASLLSALVYAAGEIAVFGMPLAPVLAFFFTLSVCYMRPLWEGIGAGILCGLSFAPLWAPAYLFAALFYVFFHSMEKERAAIITAGIGALSWMSYVSGVGILLVCVPALLLAGAAFTFFCRIFARDGAEESRAEEEGAERMGDVRYRDANERFRGISDAFSSLSEVFYNLSDRLRRPGTLDLRRVCDTAFDAVCTDCPNKTVCWGLEYADSVASVNGLISALHTKGRVSEEHFGSGMRERCARTEMLTTQINRECARVTGEMLRNNRTEIFAMDYEGAARIINEALAIEEDEYCFEPQLEKRVSVYLSDAGIAHSGVSVFGARCKRILIRGADMDTARVTPETLRSDLSEMCACDFSAAVLEVENGICNMVFRARRRFSVSVAHKNISADGGVSGDSVNVFGNKREYFYALISDGMGAGREAALTSGLCSVFLEKMLRAGNRANTSLRMLNNLLRSRISDSKDECSSTVDLLELDLMTGKCTFFKSGAAPSFVIRGGVVRRMQTGSVPIGIMCALDSGETSFDLREGDIVVMISDGILDADGESESLISLLTDQEKRTPEELAERICQGAVARGEHDDCSAVVLRIEGYEGGE